MLNQLNIETRLSKVSKLVGKNILRSTCGWDSNPGLQILVDCFCITLRHWNRMLKE